MPLDDARLLEEAKSVRDETVQVDAAPVAQRRAAMVRNVMGAGKFGLIVLGASHDLSAVVPSRCEYIRVWAKEWPG
jgi:hypothetical protein